MNIKIDLPKEFFNEEVRNDYVISKDMKKVWAVELDLLKKVLDVCKKHNINIFIDGGSLLGTIRHGGFIPWDDDIDLIMPRKDYIKLCSVAKDEFKEPYFFQTEYTDPNSTRGHIQVRNSETTGILRGELEKKFPFNQGIFIDIFIIEEVPKDAEKRKVFSKKLNKKKKLAIKYRNMLLYKWKNDNSKNTIKKLAKEFLHYGAKVLNVFFRGKNYFYYSFEKYAQKYNNSNEETYYSNITLIPNRESGFFNKDCFSETIYKPFEMLEVPVPKGYNEILDELYGDWKVFKRGTSTHGGVIFDTEKSYKEYIKKGE